MPGEPLPGVDGAGHLQHAGDGGVPKVVSPDVLGAGDADVAGEALHGAVRVSAAERVSADR